MPQTLSGSSVGLYGKKGPTSTSKMPPLVQGFHVPEDVVHLIFEEILFQGDRASFHTAALLSTTFLYVAQLFLYRSYTLNLGDPAAIRDVITLLDIIERQPYIGTFIKEFAILDIPRSEKKTPRHRHAAGNEKNDILSRPCDRQCSPYQNFIEIFTLNQHNLLPRLRGVFSSLSTVNFSFQCSLLDWHTLHKDVKWALEDLFTSGHLDTARLNGVANVPCSISSDFFNLREVEFNNSHFASASWQRNRSTIVIGRRNYMRRICMDLGRGYANFEQVVQHWCQHQATIPEVDAARLSINGWYGPWDVAVVLGVLGKCIKELSLSTTQLELAFVHQQPPRNPFLYPSMYATRLPRINSHAMGDCFLTDECDQPTSPTVQHPQTPYSQYVTSDHSSWFLQLMSPLRPRFHPRSFKMLHKLEFEVSHWRSAMEAEGNGELFWMISWLAELPLERAENIRDLSITVRVGTDFCLDNANAMTELAGYQGWGLLDMVVSHHNWRSLERVSITVRSRTTCLCGIEDKFRVLLEWLKKSMLPLLNARGIVDVTYASLESTLAS